MGAAGLADDERKDKELREEIHYYTIGWCLSESEVIRSVVSESCQDEVMSQGFTFTTCLPSNDHVVNIFWSDGCITSTLGHLHVDHWVILCDWKEKSINNWWDEWRWFQRFNRFRGTQETFLIIFIFNLSSYPIINIIWISQWICFCTRRCIQRHPLKSKRSKWSESTAQTSLSSSMWVFLSSHAWLKLNFKLVDILTDHILM